METKLEKMGLVLPAPLLAPTGASLSFALVRTWGKRAYVSGHAAQNSDGSLAGPFGKVGADLTPEQGHQAARGAALAVLASLKQELEDLNRITGWIKVLGFVNSAPGFQQQTHVIDGFSQLILELFGPERGKHARSAIGVAELPFGVAVEIEAQVAITG